MKDIDKYPEDEPVKGSQVQPYHVLAYILVVFGLLIGFMAVFPDEGVKVSDDVTLRFTSLQDLVYGDTEKVDMSAILAEVEALGAIDTTAAVEPVDSADPVNPEIVPNQVKKIQYPEEDRSLLYPVFEALSQAAGAGEKVRVIHFGDSQIEGDRMTNYIRNEFQLKFGGQGPGLNPAVAAVPSFSLRQEHSDNFKRYAGYGRKDPAIEHRRYGVTASFARFGELQPDSVLDTIPVDLGWLKLSRANAAYNRAKTYGQLRLFFGHNRRPFVLQCFVDGELLTEDSIPAGAQLRVKSWDFPQTPGTIQLFMRGQDSPEIYATSLEGGPGVQVDNIGLRGQSGTLFGGLDQSIFKGMTDQLNVKLLLLQFGGNTVPYIKSEQSAQNYGRQFRNQINYLKRTMPDAEVIVIGPSDMATKVEGKLQSYPYLEAVRDALRDAAFEAGAAYYDIYEVMGGHNSMIGWVETQPPLAGSDYVHFTPRGAKKIAKTFIASFMEDYEAYLRRKVQ